jgi:hypothetical protein
MGRVINDNELKADQGKLRYDLIPVTALEGIAEIFTYGSKKYDEFNWFKSVQPMRYYAAAMRHIMALQKGTKIDPESGLKHIDHAIVSLIMYRELTEKIVGTDLPTTYIDCINKINEK